MTANFARYPKRRFHSVRSRRRNAIARGDFERAATIEREPTTGWRTIRFSRDWDNRHHSTRIRWLLKTGKLRDRRRAERLLAYLTPKEAIRVARSLSMEPEIEWCQPTKTYFEIYPWRGDNRHGIRNLLRRVTRVCPCCLTDTNAQEMNDVEDKK